MKKRIFSFLLALVLVLSVLAACTGPRGPGFASFVVAAYNSIDSASADYICDGVDDQVEINTAIDDLPAGGGSIYLKEGTYILGDNIIISKSNVCLVGTGAATVLTIKDSKDADMRVIFASGQENLLINDLRIDGNRTNQATGQMYGIYFTGVENSKIVDCWVENVRVVAIYLDASSNNTVTGNICQENSEHGILLRGASNSNTVTGNTCQENSVHGIALSASSNNTVTGNICQESGDCGILLEISSNNNTFTGNICQEGGAYGICLYQSGKNTFTGNTCWGNGGTGIYFYNSLHNIVSSNIFEGNGNIGIYLTHWSHHNIVSANMVMNNSQALHNFYDGISIWDDCDYNNIQGNTVRQGLNPPQQRYGISIDSADCDNNLVINNDLYNAGASGDFSDVGTGTIYHNNRTSAGWVP